MNKILNTIATISTRNCEKWLELTGRAMVRAIKTMAQTMIATIGTTATIGAVDWKLTLSTTLLAGLISLLTSVAGLPEVKED